MEERITIMVDGSAVESTRVYYYKLLNTGQDPILPSDYIEPVQVTVEQGRGELLTVDTTQTHPTELEVDWSKVTTSTFSMEPTLLNPGDEVGVLLFVTNIEESDDLPQLHWTARIVGVPTLRFQTDESPAEESGLGVFYLGISHEGWSVYWLAALSSLFFIIGLLLASRFKRVGRFSAAQVLLLTVLMAFSFSSAEIIVDVVIEGNAHQWRGAWALLALHILLIVYVSWPGLRIKIASILLPHDLEQESANEGKKP
jgi:hypothetical protein